MSLKLYNTLTKKKEKFVPIEKGKVRFYVCGPTVYDYIHVGNARAFIVSDVFRRFLRFLKYDVTYVMNLTDIDDRIIDRANKEGIDTKEITEKYSRAFLEDLEALGVEPADVHPKATEHVKDIVEMIGTLMRDGYAYEVEGNVFFEVSKFEDYGKLSGKKIDELRSGARVSVDEKKRTPGDFSLWKRQKPGEPAWESPWGAGRPGWHIECSVMSMKYLGHTFDIHAGGTDLIFPHHENEIAQSEAATGEPFVKYWLHNGFLQIDGEKMAKSLGNFRTVREVMQKYRGVVIRMFFLQKHYRNPIDFTIAGLQSAERAVERLESFREKVLAITTNLASGVDENKLSETESKLYRLLSDHRQQFIQALEDDLNTPVAMSNLFEMVRLGNKLLAKGEFTNSENALLVFIKATLDEFVEIFGLEDSAGRSRDDELVKRLLDLTVEVRDALRDKKEWALADKIRDQLTEIGIVLEDAASGTKWKKK